MKYLCNYIYIYIIVYQSGEMINDFKYGIVVTFLKKKGTMKCKEYRTLNVTSYASKILCGVIMTQIQKKISLVFGKIQVQAQIQVQDSYFLIKSFNRKTSRKR